MLTPRAFKIYVYSTKIYVYFAACKQGYFGKACDVPCPPGLFGDNCGGHCFPACLNETCNHVHGCQKSTIIPFQTTNEGRCFKILSDRKSITIITLLRIYTNVFVMFFIAKVNLLQNGFIRPIQISIDTPRLQTSF